MSYHTSYWGGHPSSSNNILDELAIYVDNDKDGNYDTKTDKVWDELWVSYADKNGKIVSKKVTRETRYELCTYYAFGKGSALTELSLLAISNGELNEKAVSNILPIIKKTIKYIISYIILHQAITFSF